MRTTGPPRAVVLVEGPSDQAALQTLARRRGRDLPAEGVQIVAMGGATSIATFLARFGPAGAGLALGGLCDAAEEPYFSRALSRAGFGDEPTRGEMERLGFYVCDADLEDELIRCLGVAVVEQVIEAAGDLGSLQTFRQQPAQRDRSPEQQLRRFMGTRSGRKVEYARLLVSTLDLDRVPRPLDAVLAGVGPAVSAVQRVE